MFAQRSLAFVTPATEQGSTSGKLSPAPGTKAVKSASAGHTTGGGKKVGWLGPQGGTGAVPTLCSGQTPGGEAEVGVNRGSSGERTSRKVRPPPASAESSGIPVVGSWPG